MKVHLVLVGLVFSAMCSLAAAESFHVVSLADLDFAPDQDGLKVALDQFNDTQTGFRLPDSVDVFLTATQDENSRRTRARQRQLRVALRFSDEKAVRGFVDLRSDDQSTRAFAVTLDPGKLAAATAAQFEVIRGQHYRQLAESGQPGAAWFRHRASSRKDGDPGRRLRRRESDMSETFSMFTGKRAITQNLALDRELILGRRADDKPDVRVDGIRGIEVKAIDWKERLPQEEVKIDALATAIPLDQHAIFFPSMASFLDLLDLIDEQGAPVIGAFSVTNPFHGLASRYLAQMGIRDREKLRKLDVKSVALTGSDPFFPSGTDVALLFETDDTEKLLLALHGLTAQTRGQGHVVLHGKHVVLTNSSWQVKRLRAVEFDDTPSLGDSDEFKCFRHRYPIDAAGESAFLFLSDATIRRWGGPHLRIAASRRTRAMLALGELTARQLSGKEIGDDYAPLLGKVSLEGKDKIVTSEKFGTLDFITPVSELDIDMVTSLEKTAYERWRESYENGWAQVFDPIAVRLALGEGSNGIDLTVLPLTVDSDYREWLDLAGKAKLSAAARSVHDEAMLFVSFAVDSASESMGDFDQTLSEILPLVKIRPLSWVGQSVSVFLDDGFYWRAAEQTLADDFGNLEDNVNHLPIGIRIESKSSVKLALFMAAIKGLAETSSPDLLSWETRKHGDRSYVAVIGNGDEIGLDLVLYYATTPTALLISLDEEMLKRSMDREALVKQLELKPDAAGLPEARHAFFQSSPQMLTLLGKMESSSDISKQRRDRSWEALPILNEWHRQKREKPVEFHRETFGERLVCPGGKGYRWNSEAMTMESVAFGFPAGMKDGANPIAVLEDFNRVTAGLGFEDDGLRLWAKLQKVDPKAVAVEAEPEGVQLATAIELIPTRVGSVFNYKWASEESKWVETMEVVEPKNPGEVETDLTIIKEGEDPRVTRCRESLVGGVAIVEEKADMGDIIYKKPYQYLPEKLLQGGITRCEFEYEEVEDGEAIVTIGETTIIPIRLETVEVAAGKFENCVRVKVSTMMATEGYISSIEEVHWYKAGLGAVKIEMVVDGERITHELVKFDIPEK